MAFITLTDPERQALKRLSRRAVDGSPCGRRWSLWKYGWMRTHRG